MIDVKQAVAAAISYIRDFADYLPAKDVRLEETVLDDGEGAWRITLSFVDNPLLMGSRTYKVFDVVAETGEVKSMRVRNIIKTM